MPINQFDDLLQGGAPVQGNQYDAVVSDVMQQQTVDLRASMQAAAKTAPDAKAKVIDIANRLKVPVEMVERNPQLFQERDAVEQHPYDDLVRSSPALADWLKTPQNAAVSSDDLPALTSVARLLGIGRNLGGSAGAGLLDLASSLYAIPRYVGDVLGADGLAQESARKERAIGAFATRIQGPLAGAGFIEQNIYGGIRSVGQLAPAFVAGAMSGGVSLLAGVGLSAGGQTYNEARDQGASVRRSATAAAIQGAVEVGTEFLPAHRLLGDLAAKSGLLKTLAHQIAPEIIGEEIATALQDLNEWAFLPANKDRTLGDYLRERPSAAAATAISTITAVGATTVAGHGTARFLEQLGQQLTESKTAKRSPEAVHDLIAQATHDGAAETVYAPIDTFTTYWQSKGVDPREVATTLTGDAAAYDQAVGTGQDLAIPTANYAVQLAATEHNAFFANELRLAPEQMNAREADAFEQQLAAQSETSSPAPVASPAQPVRDNIVQQLTAAGVEPSAADAQAQLYESVFQNLGERAGVDPVALFNRYGLQIGRPELDTIASPAQTVADDSAASVPSQGIGDQGGVAVHSAQASAPRVYPDERTRQHFDNLLADLTEHARALDPAVTAEDLRPEFESRLAALDDIQQAANDSGHNPKDLLLAIAKNGGLGPESAGGLTGELRALKEGLKFGAVHGVQRVFRATQTLDDRGAPKTGLGFDVMLQKLQADPRFAWIENVDMLIDELDNAIRNPLATDSLPTVTDLAKALGMHPDQAWWKPAAPAEDDDISFDPSEFNQGPVNPFAARASTARRAYEQLIRPSAHEQGMAAAFPLGAGFGRPGAERRIDASVDKAVRADYFRRQAEYLESQAVSFAAGRINAQGRSTTPESQARSDARASAKEKRDTRIAAAKDMRGDRPQWEVPAGVWVDSTGNIGGAPRQFLLGEHRQAVETAIADGKFVPDDVLADYPDLVPAVADTLDTGEQQPRLPEAGAVRDVERQTPEFDLPFSLTAPVAKGAKGPQSSLFQTPKGWDVVEPGDSPKNLPPGKMAKGAYNPDTHTIRLFERADLSTLLHESGHFFLEVLADLSTNPDASSSVKADMQTLLEWFKYDGTAETWKALSPDTRRDAHEQFARGFETYLMEGKAPSSALRAIFGRFRAWLVGVYRTVSSLNVTLNDDVRRVFDRLVASDEAIEQAEQEGRIAPLFTDPATAGMTPEQFDAYRATVQAASAEAKDTLQRKVLRELQREQKAWWTAERDVIHAAVTAEAHAQPVYQAMSAIRKGTHPDGTSLVAGQDPLPMKLAKSELARYPADVVNRLRKRQLYTVTDGLSPDAVAEIFGFTSGDELVHALTSAPAMGATIEATTDARMREKFGDMRLDGRLAEQAEQAVFGAGRQQVIVAELKALTAGLAQGVIPPAHVLHAAAERRIAALPVREVRAGLFLMAAQRASQRAFNLLAEGSDRAGAVQAKYQELYNLALYREAVRVKEDVDARVAWVKKQDMKGRERLGKAGADYLDQWDGFLSRYEFKRVSQKVLDRRASLADWIAAQEAQGLPVDLPASVLNDSHQVNYQTLTVEEFQGVTDALKSIAHLARLKNKLLTAADKRSYEEAIGDVVTSIDTHHERTPLPLEFLPKQLKARSIVGWFASHAKISAIARAMDGYIDGGAVWERVIRPINEAATREASMNAEATKALHALMTTAYTGRELGRLHGTSFIPAINASLSNEARLMVAMNWGNEGNRQRLRDGRQWTDPQVRAILDTLDQRDWTFVQGVWDFIDTYWPAIVDKQTRVTGIAPAKVDASPVQTRFGEFKGGYFPLVYDSRLSARSGSFLDANEATLQKQAAYVKATTRRGHTEARAKANNEPVRLELSVLYGHVEQVIHDLSHHEMLIDVGRVLGDKRVQSAIYETHGDIAYQQFKSALKDIAFGMPPASGVVARALNFSRQGTQVAGLAWNAWTAVQQPNGVFNGAVRVGPSWVLKGMGRMVRDAASMESTAAWIYERSDMMRLRGLTQQREVAELRNTVTHPGGRFDNLLRTVTASKLTQQDITDSYFALIGQAQKLADMPTWLGAYEKAMAGGEEDSRAIALADQAVLDAQGGGQIKDLASAQRGGAAEKIFSMFYSYGNVLYNQTAEQVGKTNFRKAGSVGQFTVNLLLLYAFPAATTVALAKAFSKGDDDDSFVMAMGREMLGAALNTMVLVREFGGLLHASNRGYGGPAGTRLFASVQSLIQQAEQGDLDRGAVRAAEDVGAIVFRLPTSQVQRSVDGFVALQEGRTQNPLALVSGGPKEKR